MVAGVTELKRHAFQVVANQDSKAEGFFAGSSLDRVNGFLATVNSDQVDGLVALRGGYGSNYLLDFELEKSLASPKCVIGFSDITSLHIYLWQPCRGVTFYGPMLPDALKPRPGPPQRHREH